MAKKIHIAALLSGGGRTLENFFNCIDSGDLNAEITSVISSTPKAYGLKRAAKRNVPTAVFMRKNYSDDESYSRDIFAFLSERPCDLVCLAGFLKFLYIPPEWYGRVMNIHPALLPSFGGKGLYGDIVHKAVLDSGAKVSGCTVHFVDNKYDNGPIIIQRAVPVFYEDTPDALAARVFDEECIAYPEAIRLFIEERLQVIDSKVKIVSQS